MKGRCFWDVALQTRPWWWSLANRGLWWAFDSGWTRATTLFTWWSAIKPCLGIINWPLLKFISWLNSVKFFSILLFSYKQKLLLNQRNQWKRQNQRLNNGFAFLWITWHNSSWIIYKSIGLSSNIFHFLFCSNTKLQSRKIHYFTHYYFPILHTLETSFSCQIQLL